MKFVESDCVDCGLPCIYSACKHYEITRYVCDRCGEETVLFEYDGEELCLDCIKESLPVVEGSDIYEY